MGGLVAANLDVPFDDAKAPQHLNVSATGRQASQDCRRKVKAGLQNQRGVRD